MPALDPTLVSLEDAKKIIEAGVDKNLKTNRLFFEGDHWQGNTGWVGPRPKAGEEGELEAWAEVQRAFTSKNVIAEVIDRHTGGVVGHEPGWTLVPKRPMKKSEKPTPAEQTVIDEANALLTTWWDNRNGHGVLGTMVERVLYAGRQTLRLFVPQSKLAPAAEGAAAGVGQVQAATPEEAVLMIYPETPLAEQATVVVDPDTKAAVGLLILEDPETKKTSVEVVFLQQAGVTPAGGETPAQSADGAPMTMIRSFSDADKTGVSVPLPLGGRLTMMEIVRRPLITEQVRQGQRALNLALSMVPRNVVSGGFLERILLNAQLPGEFVKDETTGIEHFVPAPHKAGAGVTSYVVGLETEDEVTGKKTYTSPSAVFREPVPVTSSVDGKNNHYEDILDECAQRHVLMGSDATASGVSREQARADFEESLKQTLMLLVPLGRWLLETVLALTESFLNAPGKWTNDYRVEFRPFVNTGPLSADEIRVDNESVKAGTMSLETAMQKRGIVDIDAELARISSQADASLSLLERQVNVIKILFDVGMQPEAIGELIGMTPEQVTLLKGVVIGEKVPPVAP